MTISSILGGDQDLSPMFVVDRKDEVVWRNRWAELLFGNGNTAGHLLQLPAGKALCGYAKQVRAGQAPIVFSIEQQGLALDLEAEKLSEDRIAFRFYPVTMVWGSMLEMNKIMQDFARETAERVNNPLTTILNALEMIRNRAKTADTLRYAEMAIREADSMRRFGDWVRRLSEEPPCLGDFDLVAALGDVLAERACAESLRVIGDIPRVRGCSEHARVIFGGLVNLCRQAAVGGECSVLVVSRCRQLIAVRLAPRGPRVRNLRLLTEEFYGGLGLLAARYLLALMQAQMTTDLMAVGIQVTFTAAAVPTAMADWQDRPCLHKTTSAN